MRTNYKEKINEANIIILLIIADLFGSHCSRYREIELPRAVEKCGYEPYSLIPIIVRECVWDKMVDMLTNITTYPQSGSNVFGSLDKDATYAGIAREIISLIERLRIVLRKMVKNLL